MQLQINIRLLVLFLIVALLSFAAGWLAYDERAPITAYEFIKGCDNWAGAGEWKVVNNTCTPISYIVIPDDVNITLPIRGK